MQATIECGFTLKHVRDMTKTYSLSSIFNNICSLDSWKKIEEITLDWASPCAKLKIHVLILTGLLNILCSLSQDFDAVIILGSNQPAESSFIIDQYVNGWLVVTWEYIKKGYYKWVFEYKLTNEATRVRLKRSKWHLISRFII